MDWYFIHVLLTVICKCVCCLHMRFFQAGGRSFRSFKVIFYPTFITSADATFLSMSLAGLYCGRAIDM